MIATKQTKEARSRKRGGDLALRAFERADERTPRRRRYESTGHGRAPAEVRITPRPVDCGAASGWLIPVSVGSVRKVEGTGTSPKGSPDFHVAWKPATAPGWDGGPRHGSPNRPASRAGLTGRGQKEQEGWGGKGILNPEDFQEQNAKYYMGRGGAGSRRCLQNLWGLRVAPMNFGAGKRGKSKKGGQQERDYLRVNHDEPRPPRSNSSS